MADSTPNARPRKAPHNRPQKPYPDFPLSPHPSGAWQKKIRGKIHYFGRWGRVVNGKLERLSGEEWWKPALEIYLERKDDLFAGRTPRDKGDGLTVKELCNRFLTAKLRKQTAGEMGVRMFQEYREITDLIVSAFGKERLVDDLAADDFEVLRARMAERWGPVRLGNAITRVKSVFKYAVDNGLRERVPRFGSEFRKPDKAVLRRHRAQTGERMLEADELRRVIDGAATPLQAMILLGINAGFGNHDCATLPLPALDLERGWVDFPRPKTGISRRCPLWPETVAALRAVLIQRPSPKDQADAELVFLQASGRRWVRITEKSRTDNVSAVFCELLRECGLYRAGLGFYTLRHVFRTVADAARDPVAIDLIMGHSDPAMGGHYRERIDDSRLRAVADHVRAWLFGEAPENPNGETPDGEPAARTPEEQCEPCGPCEPVPENAGDDGTPGKHDPQKTEPGVSAPERPVLRLFVG